eukprot:Em0015g357a
MMTGHLLALFTLFQAATWMQQAEAITPTYPPSLPPLYVYNIPESYGNNLSTFENVSINAASPINAIDPGGFQVTYSIPAYSVNSDKFCMKDNASGLIYVCHRVILDREVLTPDPLRASLLLTVTASNGAFTATTTVYMYLTDVNDNPPQMTNLPATISLSEVTAIGTQVFTVAATDKDQTFYPTYTITNTNKSELCIFYLHDGTLGGVLSNVLYDIGVMKKEAGIVGLEFNPQKSEVICINSDLIAIVQASLSGPFSVAPSSGIITLSGSLDYNTQTSYTLIITLKDQLNDSIALTSTSTLTVMVIPVQPPLFTQPRFSASVSQSSTNEPNTEAALPCWSDSLEKGWEGLVVMVSPNSISTSFISDFSTNSNTSPKSTSTPNNSATALSLGVLVTIYVYKKKSTVNHRPTPDAPCELVGNDQNKIDDIHLERNFQYREMVLMEQ